MINSTRPWKFTLLLFFFLCTLRSLQAQELTFLYGRMHAPTLDESSFAWQIDYRQTLYRNLAASIAYINEGHVTGHHRDGTAWELWGRLPFAENRFELSLGAGAYYYYDTQYLPSGGGTANVHGTALIYSLSGTGYFSDRWFYRLMINRIEPRDNIEVTTGSLGLGVWFGQNKRPIPGQLGAPADEKDYVSDNEIVAYYGQSVVNTFLSEQARALALEYRRGLVRHIDGSATFIYEGDPEIIRRSGVAFQAWAVNSFFHERISVGVGVGPYIFIDRKNPAPKDQKNPAALAPLVSLTFATRISEHWVARLMFHRVTSSYNRDADVFLLGLGYRWGH